MTPAPEVPPVSGGEGHTDYDARFRPSPAIDASIPYTPRLRVDELYIGNGLVIKHGRGTHASDGRLSLQGVGANSCEIEVLPGPDCKTGIASQVMFFGHFIIDGIRKGWTRWSVTTRKQSDGSPIITIGPDSMDRPTPPMEFVTGGQTRPDGSDDGGRTMLLIFESGQIDVVEPNGSRRTVRQPGGVPADSK